MTKIASYARLIEFNGDALFQSGRTMSRIEIADGVQEMHGDVGIQKLAEVCDIIKDYEDAKFGPVQTFMVGLIILFAVNCLTVEQHLVSTHDHVGVIFFSAVIVGLTCYLLSILYWPARESESLDAFVELRYSPLGRALFDRLAEKDKTIPRELVEIAKAWKW